MDNSKEENKFQIFILGISPFLALISREGGITLQNAVILVILLLINVLIRKKFVIRINKIHKVFLSLMLVITLSTAINTIIHNNVASTENLIELFYMYVIFLWFYLNTTSYVSKEKIMKILSCYNIVSVIMSIQIIKMSISGVAGKIMITNFAGVLMDENCVTALIAMTPIYAFTKLLYYKNNFFTKCVVLFEIIICTAGVALAGSRAALIGMGMGLFITLAYYLKDKISFKKIIIMFGIVIVGIFFIANLKNIMPVWIYNRYFNSNYMDNSNTQRILIWKNALSGISNQPILGFGMGTFPNLKQYAYTAGQSTPAHQTLLDMGLYGGIIGIIIFIYLIYLIIFPIVKNKKTKKYTGAIFCIFFISMILSATKSMFLWNNLIFLTLLYQMETNTRIGDEQK